MPALFLALFLGVILNEWKVATPDFDWEFPRDHWAHDGYRTEWWYFTGHLQAPSGRRFAYQFTLFRIGVVRDPPQLDSAWTASALVMGHAAVTDLRSKRHIFSEVLYREIPLLSGYAEFPAPRIGWSRAPPGTDADWYLEWKGEGFELVARDDALDLGFRLTTSPVKNLVLQGPNGFSRKSAGGAASHYYSLTRLETEGELTFEGERLEVTGLSWMDKEFSSSHLGMEQIGWDWFSLQLADGRDLMLYLMRASDGGVDTASGTLVSAEGVPQYLSPESFEVEVFDHWTSLETGARYPSRWRIRVLGETLVVSPLVSDQENRSRLRGGIHYWEGAVSVERPDGKAIGQGFVELTGYGVGNRPPL